MATSVVRTTPTDATTAYDDLDGRALMVGEEALAGGRLGASRPPHASILGWLGIGELVDGQAHGLGALKKGVSRPPSDSLCFACFGPDPNEPPKQHQSHRTIVQVLPNTQPPPTGVGCAAACR